MRTITSLSLLVPGLLIGGSGLACSSSGDGAAGDEGPAGSTRSEVIYGTDDRVDPFDYSDPSWAARTEEFSVALVPASAVDTSNPNDVQIGDRTLGERLDVCPDERFVTQPANADCSGTLIDTDLVLTAGHCINNCNDSRFIFDYVMEPSGTPRTITIDDVYSCVDFITWTQSSTGLDYTVVRLDRPVTGRTPAAIRVSDAPLAVGTDLVVSGFPSGLPLKIADNAAIRSNQPALQFFVANLDTFVGNSGSGVFTPGTEELAGILVRGAQDYVQDGDCLRPNVCADDACRGEDAIYSFHAVRDVCERTPATFCSCGEGACGPLESPASCPSDCTCGDGICSTGESTSSCPADCRFEVLYHDHAPQPNWMTPGIQVRNTGSDSIFVGFSTVRYYFTQEPAGTLSATCWGCTTMPTVSFHELPGGGCADATHYMDVTLPSMTLPPSGTTEQWRLAVHASSWGAFDQTNDYSHAGPGNWAPNPKITMYRLGMRVFGDEPCPGLFIPPAD